MDSSDNDGYTVDKVGNDGYTVDRATYEEDCNALQTHINLIGGAEYGV